MHYFRSIYEMAANSSILLIKNATDTDTKNLLQCTNFLPSYQKWSFDAQAQELYVGPTNYNRAKGISLERVLEEQNQCFSKTVVIAQGLTEQQLTPRAVELLKRIYVGDTDTFSRGLYKVILVGSDQLTLPQELVNIVLVADNPTLNKVDQIVDIINFKYQAEKAQIHYFSLLPIEVAQQPILSYARTILGRTQLQIEYDIISLFASYQFNNDSLCRINTEFLQANMSNFQLLEVTSYPTNRAIDSNIGMNALNEWINHSASLFDDSKRIKELDLDLLKGVLLTGLPGCGKSTCAQNIANIFHLPLVQLNLSKLVKMDDTQAATLLTKELKGLESYTPCVLLIDEVEQLSSKVKTLQQIITWLNTKQSLVFTVAIANDLSMLPETLLNSQCFDQAFFANLPNRDSRIKLLRKHLDATYFPITDTDLAVLADNTEGFSQADLASMVKKVKNKIWFLKLFNSELFKQKALKVIKDFKPLAQRSAQQIEQLTQQAHKLNIPDAALTSELGLAPMSQELIDDLIEHPCNKEIVGKIIDCLMYFNKESLDSNHSALFWKLLEVSPLAIMYLCKHPLSRNYFVPTKLNMHIAYEYILLKGLSYHLTYVPEYILYDIDLPENSEKRKMYQAIMDLMQKDNFLSLLGTHNFNRSSSNQFINPSQNTMIIGTDQNIGELSISSQPYSSGLSIWYNQYEEKYFKSPHDTQIQTKLIRHNKNRSELLLAQPFVSNSPLVNNCTNSYYLSEGFYLI